MDWFKTETPKETVRKNDRALRHTQRDLEKDRRDIERQEKQLESDIRKMAKQGNKQACATLAKQLVNAMHSNVKMADVMKSTTKTMGEFNKQMNPQQVAKTMDEFGKANMQMDMKEEMINDTLESILDESGDEAESDAIVNKVLDEIGIEISGKLAEAPAPQKGGLKVGEASGSSKQKLTDADIDRMLQDLKT